MAAGCEIMEPYLPVDRAKKQAEEGVQGSVNAPMQTLVLAPDYGIVGLRLGGMAFITPVWRESPERCQVSTIGVGQEVDVQFWCVPGVIAAKGHCSSAPAEVSGMIARV
jgi:hypothetical protein